MGKIIISTNATLDGVVQDSDGLEGFERGGWFKQLAGKDLEAWAKLFTDEAMQASALLLGRRSEHWFGTRWASRTGAWADRLNGMPKYVVSSSLDKPVWGNATMMKGDVAKEVSKLKQKVHGDILVYASYQLAHALMEHDLVDELRLVVFPVVLGGGKRLFGETSKPKPFRMVETRALGESLAFLTYQRA